VLIVFSPLVLGDKQGHSHLSEGGGGGCNSVAVHYSVLWRDMARS